MDETTIMDLLTQGDGWGLMAALLWIAWRIWRDVKPHLIESLKHKGRAVDAQEQQAEATGKVHESLESLTEAVNKLSAGGVLNPAPAPGNSRS